MTSTSSKFITLGYSNSTYNQAEISFYLSSSGSSSNRLDLGLNGGTKMSILPSGYVGIGISNPSYGLDVSGSIRASSWLYGTIGSASQTNITSVGTLSSLNVSGSVGIGNTSPYYELDVSGSIRASSYLYGNTGSLTRLLVGTSTDTSRLISALDSGMGSGTSRYITLGYSNSSYNQAEISFYLSSNGSNANRLDFGFNGVGSRMSLKASGFLGIGTTDPNCPLRIGTFVTYTFNSPFAYYARDSSSGNALYGGNGYTSTLSSVSIHASGRVLGTEFDAFSDIRLKNNIVNLEKDFCKNFINNTQPVSYQFNNTNETKKHYGYIAQDLLKKGYNDLIGMIPDETVEEYIDADGFVSPAGTSLVLNYNQIIPILSVLVKDLYNENEQLKAETSELNNKNNNLENRINTLENENNQLKEQINNILLRLQNLENN
jgi:FtsZ-binding cell division protein ZapB